MHWWPRQTPRMGVAGPKRRTTSVEIPASPGEHGPGEMMIWEGRSASISSGVVVSWRRLELGEALHRSHCGGGGDGPAGERRAHQVQRIVLRGELAHHGGDEVVHRLVVLEREQLGHAHAAHPTHA